MTPFKVLILCITMHEGLGEEEDSDDERAHYIMMMHHRQQHLHAQNNGLAHEHDPNGNDCSQGVLRVFQGLKSNFCHSILNRAGLTIAIMSSKMGLL